MKNINIKIILTITLLIAIMSDNSNLKNLLLMNRIDNLSVIYNYYYSYKIHEKERQESAR